MIRALLSRRSVYVAAALVAVIGLTLFMSSGVVGAGNKAAVESGEWTIVSNGATEGGYLLNTETGELWLVRADSKKLVTDNN
jgi:putative copper export protein